MKSALTYLFLFSSLGAHALDLQGGPSSRFRLGHGVEPLTQQVFNRCIEYDKGFENENGLDPDGLPKSGVEMPVRIEQVTSVSQLDRYSSSSVSAGASYAFVSGGFSRTQTSAKSVFSDRAMVGIEAGTNYGRFYLKNPRLKPEYAQLAATNIRKFYDTCGTEYISGFTLGQGLRVLMTASTDITKSFESMSAAVSAGVQYGAIGGSFAGSFANAASSLLALGSLQVDFVSYGGGELKDLSGLIKSDGDAKQFRDLISKYMEGLDATKAVRTGYISQPYFPDRSYDPLLTEVKHTAIKRLFEDFRYLHQNQDRLNQAFAENGTLRAMKKECEPADRKPICDTYLASLTALNKKVTEKLDRIRDAVSACVAAKTVADCDRFVRDRYEVEELRRTMWPAHFRYQLLQSNLDEIRNR